MQGLSCAYHCPAASRLTSLRDFRAPRCRSRVAVAVAERSEAVGSETAAQGGRQPSPPPPQADASDFLHHLTAQQRDQVTQHVLRAFLNHSDVAQSGDGPVAQRTPSRRRRHQHLPHQQQHNDSNGQQPEAVVDLPSPNATAKADSKSSRSRGSKSSGVDGSSLEPPPRQRKERKRGVQGQLVEHLLSGGFDEALLEPVPTHTLNWVIKVLGEQSAVLQAEQLFHWMRLKGKANQFSFAKLCEACSAARQPRRAFQVWRTTRRMPQARQIEGSQAGVALILAYRSTGDHQGALRALDMLEQHRFPLNRYAYNAAIRVCADAGAANYALSLLSRLRQLAAEAEAQRAQRAQQAGGQRGGAARTSSGAFKSAADGASKSGAKLAAAGVSSSGANSSSSASQKDSTHDDTTDDLLRTDCRSYSAALAAIAAAGKWNRGAQLHRWLIEDGVRPDAPLCAQLLSCYAAVGQAAAAQQLVDAMIADPRSRPNRTHWNGLLLAYAAAHDMPGSAAAYLRMKAAGVRPDSYTMLALLRAAFHAGQGLAAVQAVQQEMKAYCLGINRQLGTAMLCCLRHVRPAAGGFPTMHLQTTGSSVQPAPADSGLIESRVACCSGEAGSGDAAAQPLLQKHQLQRPGQQKRQQQQQQHAKGEPCTGAQPCADAQLASAACSATDGEPGDQREACLAAATAVFAALRKQAAKRRCPLDLRAYNSLLLVQLAAGDHDGVLRTFQELESEAELRPDATTLGVVISACKAAGWRQREEQYRQLLEGSRLLGALRGDEDSAGGSGGGKGKGGFRPRRGKGGKPSNRG